jgi:hypothetical protein
MPLPRAHQSTGKSLKTQMLSKEEAEIASRRRQAENLSRWMTVSMSTCFSSVEGVSETAKKKA